MFYVNRKEKNMKRFLYFVFIIALAAAGLNINAYASHISVRFLSIVL